METHYIPPPKSILHYRTATASIPERSSRQLIRNAMVSPLATISSNRIDQKFETLRGADRKALVCYVTAGHPDRRSSIELMRGLEGEGADIIEVGVPFSDPIADGPVIQQSSQQALANGMTLTGALELVREARLEIPVVLFTYLNPLLSGGSDILVEARDAGIDGVL